MGAAKLSHPRGDVVSVHAPNHFPHVLDVLLEDGLEKGNQVDELGVVEVAVPWPDRHAVEGLLAVRVREWWLVRVVRCGAGHLTWKITCGVRLHVPQTASEHEELHKEREGEREGERESERERERKRKSKRKRKRKRERERETERERERK